MSMLKPSCPTIPIDVIKNIIFCENLIQIANVIVFMIVDIISRDAFADKVIFEIWTETLKKLIPTIAKGKWGIFGIKLQTQFVL